MLSASLENMTNSDDIYRAKQNELKPFEFNDSVTRVFDDMIRRSVPGYAQIIEFLPTVVRNLSVQMHATGRSYRFYDLGCSLGAGLLSLAHGVEHSHSKLKEHSFIGIDSSQPMIAQANENLRPWFQLNGLSLELLTQDILSLEMRSSDLVLMNFTLQFIELSKRASLIGQIYSSLQPGGCLVLSEKIRFDDSRVNSALIDIHHQFKADQGYTELEISQKRDAIENVLIPESIGAHVHRLESAGFSVVTPWLQNLQFISFLAIK